MRVQAQKRFSPLKFTKSQVQRNQDYSPNKKNQKLQSTNYYCHYSNAHYMGGINSFKKHGRGILLLDDGSSAITQFSHDSMVGHNVIFRKDLLISIDVYKNRNKSIMYRSESHLIALPYNTSNEKQGVGIFIDYVNKKLFKLNFHRNQLQKKIRVQNNQILNKIFISKNLAQIINDNHVKALQLDIEMPIGSKIMTKGSEVMVGYCQKIGQKKGSATILDGLGFKININTDPLNHFTINNIERGLYEKSRLMDFGEKHFSNGNFYIGNFINNTFHGKGVLVNPKEKKWTIGEYSNGQLVNLQKASTDGKHSWYQPVKELHEDYTPYIQFKMNLGANKIIFEQNLQLIVKTDPYESETRQYHKNISKNNENLKTIQEDFIQKEYAARTQTAINETLHQSVEKRKKLSLQKKKELNEPKEREMISRNRSINRSTQKKESKEKVNRSLKSRSKQSVNKKTQDKPDKIQKQKKIDKYRKREVEEESSPRRSQFYRTHTTLNPIQSPYRQSKFVRQPVNIHSSQYSRNMEQNLEQLRERRMLVEDALSRSRSREDSARKYDKRIHRKQFNYLESLDSNDRIQYILERNIERINTNRSPYKRY